MSRLFRKIHLYLAGKPRLPLIMQSESSECALACLAMVAGFHGCKIDMRYARSRISISNRGVDIQCLIDMADQFRLVSRPLRLEPEEASELELPCILHWRMDHFVVLKEVRKDKVVIHDPALGECHLTLAEFDRVFTGVALELAPAIDFKKETHVTKLKLRDCWSSISGLTRSTIAILTLSLLLQMFAIVSPLYMQIVVDQVLAGSSSQALLGLAMAFCVVLLMQVSTTSLRAYTLMHIQFRLNVQMGANLFRHLLRLPLDYFIKRHTGDIVSRFTSLDQVRRLLTSGVVTALVDGAMSILMLAAMFYYDAGLSAIVIATTAVYVIARSLLFSKFQRTTQESITARARMDSHFLESIRAVQTIKLFQKENNRLAQWQNNLSATLGKEMKLAGLHINFGSVNALLFGLENIVVIYLAVMRVSSGELSIGMFYAFLAYKSGFIHSIDSLVSNWLDYRMVDVHLERLSDIVFTPTEEAIAEQESNTKGSIAEPVRHKAIVGEIEVRNLAFRYSDQEPFIFRNLNFSIKAGEVVAITGPSGCGKTTLLKCMLGLLRPTEGSIFVDGVDIAHCPHYRQQIAAVMQEDQLLSGSIKDNVACFDAQADMDRVLRAAHMACIESEIMSMPMTFNTQVGDLGASLSGGQKQRLLLARALYREPRILYMDEATSHLDVNMEARVNQNINTLHVTRILIAHRPETVRSAGRQIVLSVSSTESVH